MSIIGNILWIIFGGLLIAMIYFIGAITSCLTIIGIPFGIQLFKIGVLSLAPFGQQIVSTSNDGGCVMTVFNIIWIFTGGISIALTHLIFGVLLCVTIIGIPFGMQHFKMMRLAFTPFGKTF